MTHHPAPAESGPYDTCEQCSLPIVQHWERRSEWVTMLGGNPECYGN